MREILFKAKRKDNGEWVEGYLYINGRNGKREILCYEKDVNIERVTYEVQAKTVCQYTGLKDKNGKEIYEGDIVRIFVDSSICTVKFAEENWYAFIIEDIKTKECMNLCEFDSDDYEVIGNKFDNPELFEGGAE